MLKLFVYLFVSGVLAQQVGIGTTSVHPSALLELNSANKGLLLPRVSLNSLTDITTVPNPVVGLMVYDVGSNLINGVYFWDGSQWDYAGTIGLPDLEISFDLDSQAGTASFKEVITGLPESPGRIRVLYSPRDPLDNNFGYNFQAFGCQPGDDDGGVNSTYGGLIFA